MAFQTKQKVGPGRQALNAVRQVGPGHLGERGEVEREHVHLRGRLEDEVGQHKECSNEKP